MFDLEGWWIDEVKFICQNVVVYNEDVYWFIKVDGVTLDMDFYCAEDALNEAEQYIDWD